MKNFFTLLLLSLYFPCVSHAADHISGTLGACVGATSHLTDSLFPKGTWSSNNNLVATVDKKGNVTGVAIGTATITYTHGSYVTATFIVSPVPAIPRPTTITGTTTICPGCTTHLSDNTYGGTWSASGEATVTGDGLVTGGANAGTAIIYYSMGPGCASSTVVTVTNFTIDPITGPSVVYSMMTITLAHTKPGGVWSSANTGIATVSPDGVVTGVASGNVNISYTVTSPDGPVSALKSIHVQ